MNSLKGLRKTVMFLKTMPFKAQDEIQKITDSFVKQVDDVYKEKEKEIIEF